MTQDPRLRLQSVVPDDGSVQQGRRGWPTAPPGTPGASLAYDEGFPDDPPVGAAGWEAPATEPTRGGAWDPSSRASAWDPPARGIARWLPASWTAARWDPGRWGAVALAAVVVAAAVVAGIGVWGGRPVAEPVPALPVVAGSPSSSPAPAPVPAAGPVVVHVAGKVRRPGLVTLQEGARVGEAVEAAGGALPKVDLTPLNLAARVVDGQQIVVGAPAAAAAAPGSATPGAAAPGSGAPGASAPPSGDGKLDLNAATLEQLDGLPGVGPVTAKKILDWRTQNGRFAAVEQLREIAGIGEARFGTLRELVRV